jgi:hypothetical protein
MFPKSAKRFFEKNVLHQWFLKRSTLLKLNAL